MFQNLSLSFFVTSSEAEALNFEAGIPKIRDLILSIDHRLARREVPLYPATWGGKAAVTRIVQARQQALIRIADHQTQVLGRELLATRHELARLALAPAGPGSSIRLRLQTLAGRKEELSGRSPTGSPNSAASNSCPDGPPPTWSGACRPVQPSSTSYATTISSRPQSSGYRACGTPSYVAFVLRPGQAAVPVYLGPAEPIDRPSRAARGHRGPASEPGGHNAAPPGLGAAGALLPAGTKTVWPRPTGVDAVTLGGAAGPTAGGVLLEDYALAVVPHGLYLLDALTAERAERKPDSGLAGSWPSAPSLTTEPAACFGPRSSRAPRGRNGRPAGAGGYLPATDDELGAVTALAGPRLVVRLAGEEASTARVLAELPAARWAHFATHGFFADPGFAPTCSSTRRPSRGVGRAAPGARSPGVLSGLVLAGANLPVPKDDLGLPAGDGGILTAEAIAGLPLPDLELVVPRRARPAWARSPAAGSSACSGRSTPPGPATSSPASGGSTIAPRPP
ncbi:MAG: CHAT domain-containing protein [Singulisphaera sp.]